MKIKNLEVKNFKSCPDGTYELSKINVLLGKNGRGKTSMQMALRYLLNGVLPNDPDPPRTGSSFCFRNY